MTSKNILRAGEGPRIEFKERLPSHLDLARNVSALANTHGGVIVVGARKKNPQIVYGGEDPRVNQHFDDLQERLRPFPPMHVRRVKYSGGIVSAIVVKSLRLRLWCRMKVRLFGLQRAANVQLVTLPVLVVRADLSNPVFCRRSF